MAQYVAFRGGVEILGQTVVCVLEAMGEHAPIAYKLLAKHGVRSVVPDGWYPQQVYLDILRRVTDEVGEYTLLGVGKKIHEYAEWPANITTIEAGLASIDVAYHLNHRVNGEVMFDPKTGAMKEGIGHYGYRQDGPRRSVMVCENPFPCDFDRGIILGVGRKFKPFVDVVEDASEPCRKRGGASCTYVVKW